MKVGIHLLSTLITSTREILAGSGAGSRMGESYGKTS